MFKIIRILSISLSALSLTACMIDGTDSTFFSPFQSSNSSNSSNMLYPDGYETIQPTTSRTEEPVSSSQVVVPQSYHVGLGGPQSSKDVDKNWVNSQNPQAYTIEIAQDPKASYVASTLYKAPKNERTAEVKANNGDYKGLYGSYPSYEAAQEKLNSLPDDLKQHAGIKTWNQVQQDLQ